MSANQPPENSQQGQPQLGPDGQPLQQGQPQQPGAQGEPQYPGQPQFGPDGQPLGYQGGQPQFGPDGQPLGYQGGQPQFGPDGQPLQPGYQSQPQFGPDGQPLQPGYPPAGGGFAPQVEEPKKASRMKRILTSVGIALVVIVVSVLWRSGVFDSASMKAGDCVQKTGEDSVKVVACGTADAQYTVLGVVEKQSRYSAQAGVCKAWADTTTIYWEGRTPSSGTIYCLKKL